MGSGSITIGGETTYIGTSRQNNPVDSAVNSAMSVEKIYEEAKAEYEAQKWIGDNTAQPTDQINAPRLWVAEAFPHAEYPKLWNSSARLASDKGVHVAIRKPAFGIVESEISVYKKDGTFIGKTIVSPFDEQSISEGIGKLTQMIDGSNANSKPDVISEKFGIKDKAMALVLNGQAAIKISDADPKVDPKLEQYSKEQRETIKTKAREIATDELMKLQGSDRNFDGFSLNAVTPQYYAAAIKELNY